MIVVILSIQLALFAVASYSTKQRSYKNKNTKKIVSSHYDISTTTISLQYPVV